MNQRTKKAKPAAKYPYIGFRPSGPMKKRLVALCKTRNLTISAVLNHCLMVGLPELEG
jgi:hypothetical protein